MAIILTHLRNGVSQRGIQKFLKNHLLCPQIHNSLTGFNQFIEIPSQRSMKGGVHSILGGLKTEGTNWVKPITRMRSYLHLLHFTRRHVTDTLLSHSL